MDIGRECSVCQKAVTAASGGRDGYYFVAVTFPKIRTAPPHCLPLRHSTRPESTRQVASDRDG
jgi:hypothetical protein